MIAHEMTEPAVLLFSLLKLNLLGRFRHILHAAPSYGCRPSGQITTVPRAYRTGVSPLPWPAQSAQLRLEIEQVSAKVEIMNNRSKSSSLFRSQVDEAPPHCHSLITFEAYGKRLIAIIRPTLRSLGQCLMLRESIVHA